MGLVTYGGVSGGLRAAQMTKQIVTALKMMPMMEAVAIPFVTRFIDPATGAFAPEEAQSKAAVLLDELLRWTEALAPLRHPNR